MKNIYDIEWRKPKILLINFGIEALGIRHLSSFLKKLKCKVNVLFLKHKIDINFDHFYADLICKFIDYSNYEIVGFSCMTGDYYEVKSITRLIKEKMDNPPAVIWGGVHPTVCPKECLRDGGADIVFNGAAEESLSKLLSGTSINEVTNIAYLDNGELFNHYSDIYLVSPDSMPFPDFDFEDHFVIKDKKIVGLNRGIFRLISIWNGTHYYAITSRGCPYNCKYCCNIYKGHFKRKSVDYFLEELRYIEKKLPFFQTLSIQDDSLFLGTIAWITDFSEKYKNEFNKPLRAAMMPRFATLDKLEPLSKAGLTYVGIGLQGSSRLNNEIYGRLETSESFLQAVNNSKKFGIICRADLIIDNPYEKEEDLLEMANTLNEVPKPFPIVVYSLTLFPGTIMTEKAKIDGTAHLFAGDPYKPGLFIDKEEGTYKTPAYWRKLYTAYIPNLPHKFCKYLINNIQNQNIRKKIISYASWSKKINKIGMEVRNINPRKFDQSLKFFHKLIN